LAQTFRGDGTRVVVTHAATVLSEIRVCQGSLSFPLASAEIDAPPRFLLALPPRSVLPMRFVGARVDSCGTARFEPPAFAAPLFVAGASLADAPAAWRSACCTWLDADLGVATAVRDARRALHDLIAHPAPVRAAARRVNLAAATLARQFSRAYGLSPKEYCQRARVFEGVLRLLEGARVIDAAFTAGFADLTRFYVAFRRIVGVTPGVYARVKNRQDRSAGSRHGSDADPGP
jgi:AraC-like DNA-binding protein